MRDNKRQQEAFVSRSLSNASSRTVLAADELESEIKLTKFSSLTHDPSHVISMGSLTDQTTTGAQNTKTASMVSLSKNLLHRPFNSIGGNSKHQQMSLRHSSDEFEETLTATTIDNNQEHRTIYDLTRELERQIALTKQQNKQFQVVWRSLSFDVETSNYDKLINLAINSFNSIIRLGCLSSKRDNCCASSAQNVLTAQNKVPSTSALSQFNSIESLAARKRNKPSTSFQRNVFTNLNGYIKSGEISAILGPSGAGKTSLLNALCGGTLDNYRGTIQLLGGGNDQKRRMQLSIIPQKDYLIENLTVRENLYYSSQLLNTDSNFNHEANVTRVVRMLNLGHCFESPAANISGGEYKRVSIAQELLRQPDILILDEPTSGLDSLNCKKLIRTLKQLIEASKQGSIKPIAVVMTIHQPDIEIFNMFDHVYCMARRGRIVFDGHPSEAMQTLRAHAGFVLGAESAPPELSNEANVNPANLLIEVASEDLYGNEPIELLARLQRKQFEQMFGASGGSSPPESLDIDNTTKGVHSQQQPFNVSILAQQAVDCSSPGRSLKRDKRLHAKHDHRGKFWYHTRLLTRRTFVSALRDPLMTIVSLLFHLFVPIVMWAVYPRQIGRTNACPVIQRDLDIVTMASNKTLNKMNQLQADMIITLECSTMLFITAYALSMCTLTIAALAFPLNMHILLKEVRNGWYDLKTSVLAKQFACLPFEVLFPAMTMVMIYVMLDMPSSEYQWRLWSIALIMAAIAMISNTHGLIIGTLCMDSVQSAVFLAIASTLPQIMLSGFTVRLKWLPALFQHMSWISQYRYSSDLINAIRFGFGICPCDDATDEYLRSKKPNFTDLPDNLKPMFLYYLTTTNNAEGANSDEPTAIGNATLTSLQNATTTNIQQVINSTQLISGVSDDLALSSAERTLLLAKMESNEVDIFGQMAEMMSRSLSYGRQITSCDSVRSQMLEASESNAEDMFTLMVAGMIGLLLFSKLILFIVVKLKVGSRT